ncbi:heme-binding protein [uncultured Fusobacterium sp.]|uniref:heme-binding protein n=1 Tax=uncultured Fusobacterium sp. TaxID=159267 RepID=UPI0025EC2677|nr:heme-binding protein [uncultured Fusobacterium sp.]
MEKLLREEKELQFKNFNNEEALKLGLLIIELAKKYYSGRGVAILIEKNREPIFTYLMEGMSIDNIDWLYGKKNLVDRYNHSSQYINYWNQSLDGKLHEIYSLDPSVYRAFGGSYPLFIENVGSITVGGLSGDEDHELCVKAIREYLGK